ncbi:MAG: hypothetical protein BYD32DRAFT_146486, partial [Podila humilis]
SIYPKHLFLTHLSFSHTSIFFPHIHLFPTHPSFSHTFIFFICIYLFCHLVLVIEEAVPGVQKDLFLYPVRAKTIPSVRKEGMGL